MGLLDSGLKTNCAAAQLADRFGGFVNHRGQGPQGLQVGVLFWISYSKHHPYVTVCDPR